VPVLAVVDQVDAGLALARDHVRHPRAQPALVLRLVREISGRAPLVERDQVLWPRRLPAWLVKIRSGISPT
jgi:hypothetical protein